MTFILFILFLATVWFLIKLVSAEFSNDKHGNGFSINFKNGYEVKRRKSAPSKTYIKNGYLRFKNSGRYVHRWIMERHLGRRLYYNEVVHHIDGDKLNNRIENLRLFKNQEEHNRHHLNNLRILGDWYEREPEYINYQKFLTYAK